MIEAKLSEVQDAFRAFVGRPQVPGSGIANAKLPAKAAYRVGRLISSLRDHLTTMEETQRTLFRGAGAVLEDGQLVMRLSPREENEPDDGYMNRVKAHQDAVRALTAEIEGLLEDTVKIDADPVPMDLFGASDLMPSDCAMAGKFLKE